MNEVEEKYTPPGAEEWKAPKENDDIDTKNNGVEALNKQVEAINTKYREYEQEHPELGLDKGSFSRRAFSLLRHAAENPVDNSERANRVIIEYGQIVDTLTDMTSEQQQRLASSRRMNEGSARFMDQEWAGFRRENADKVLSSFLIERARENGIAQDEMTNLQSIMSEEGARTDRADRILDEMGKFRTIDANFITPK